MFGNFLILLFLPSRMNISLDRIISDNAIINSPEELYETFVHFFSRGAPAERYMVWFWQFLRMIGIYFIFDFLGR